MKILCALVLWLPLLAHGPHPPRHPQDEEVDPATIRALMARCGQDVGWVEDWDDAASRARETGRPVLVLFRTLASFDLPDAAMTGPFMDEDIVALVNERFVPLRFHKGMQAPFKSQESYGLGPFAFGTSLLVATPEGEIVGDTFTMEESTVFEFLAREAREHGAEDRADGEPAEGVTIAARARRQLRRGELAQADESLSQAKTAEELRLLAKLRMLQRRGDDALEALSSARAAGAPPADTAIAEAQACLRLGRLEACEAALARVPAGHPDVPKALYNRATLHLVRSELDEARRAVRKLVREHPDTREASLAAVYLSLGPLLEQATGRYPSWPAPAVLASLEASPFEPAEPEVAVQTARAFLLETQRDNGSWVTAAEVMSGSTAAFVDSETLGNEYRNPLTVANSALGARALLTQPDDAARRALERAFSFLADAHRVNLDEGDPFGVMDYTVWSKPTLLLTVSDGLRLGAIERETWLPVLEQLVAQLASKQKSGGGWSYYQGDDLENLDPNFDISFSFVTAYVLHGLWAAREAGVDVPGQMTDAALGCLERMRNDDGSFEYSLYHANESARGAPLPAGAAGREPLCALALHTWGRTDAGEVIEALEAFLRHRASYAKEKGKSVMHGGTEGQGSHYLMFDYAWAAAAAMALGEADREPFVRALREQVLDARLANGGYLDNPLLGDRFGAAMGLWSLQQLAR